MDRDTGQPLTLGIIVDQSASQAERRAEHHNIITRIAEQVLRPADRVFVMAVHEDIRLWADYTNNAMNCDSIDAAPRRPIRRAVPEIPAERSRSKAGFALR